MLVRMSLNKNQDIDKKELNVSSIEYIVKLMYL